MAGDLQKSRNGGLSPQKWGSWTCFRWFQCSIRKVPCLNSNSKARKGNPRNSPEHGVISTLPPGSAGYRPPMQTSLLRNKMIGHIGESLVHILTCKEGTWGMKVNPYWSTQKWKHDSFIPSTISRELLIWAVRIPQKTSENATKNSSFSVIAHFQNSLHVLLLLHSS